MPIRVHSSHHNYYVNIFRILTSVNLIGPFHLIRFQHVSPLTVKLAVQNLSFTSLSIPTLGTDLVLVLRYTYWLSFEIVIAFCKDMGFFMPVFLVSGKEEWCRKSEIDDLSGHDFCKHFQGLCLH